MSPREQIKQKLLSMSGSEFDQIRERYKDYWVEFPSETRQGFVDGYLKCYDANEEFARDLRGLLCVENETEYDRSISERQAIAAETAAQSVARSARAAERSADAADRAKGYVRLSMIGTLISAAVAVVMLVWNLTRQP